MFLELFIVLKSLDFTPAIFWCHGIIFERVKGDSMFLILLTQNFVTQFKSVRAMKFLFWLKKKVFSSTQKFASTRQYRTSEFTSEKVTMLV